MSDSVRPAHHHPVRPIRSVAEHYATAGHGTASPYPRTGPHLFMETTTGQPRLRIVTFGDTEPDAHTASGFSPCTDDYICSCPQHAAERERVVKRGVRPRRPLPVRRAA